MKQELVKITRHMIKMNLVAVLMEWAASEDGDSLSLKVFQTVQSLSGDLIEEIQTEYGYFY